MGRDLFMSVSGYNVLCRWWKRNERDDENSDYSNADELIHKRIPKGSFWAKEESPEIDRDNIVGGVFLMDSTHVTLKTPDNCEGLESKDLVEYEGEIWIVDSVQKRKPRKQNTYFARDKHCSHFWYIELRK